MIIKVADTKKKKKKKKKNKKKKKRTSAAAVPDVGETLSQKSIEQHRQTCILIFSIQADLMLHPFFYEICEL